MRRTAPAIGGRQLAGQEWKQLGEESFRATGVHVVPGIDCHQHRIGDAAGEGNDLVLWKMAAGSTGNDQSVCADEVQVLPPCRVRVVPLSGNGVQYPPVKR